MLILITYDLKKPGKDYSDLYKTIKSLGNWWHYLESTWLIDILSSDPNKTVNDISSKIKTVMDSNDFLFVTDISNKARQGWLPKEAWDWINQKV